MPAERRKAWLSWSTGKDSAWTLAQLRQLGEVEVTGLLTTVREDDHRVVAHGVAEALLDAQAEAVGLPLVKVPLPSPCSNAEYEARMAKALEGARAEGVTVMAFGDLYLEDVRRYREDKLEGSGIEPVFPLWGIQTARLAREMVDAGLRAVVTCVDPHRLDGRFVGRVFDATFLDALPEGVDLCGERGEFHTYVFEGPMFKRAIRVAPGDVVERDGFVFADVTPGA